MHDFNAVEPGSFAPSQRARIAVRVLGAIIAASVAYACWRGYQNPDFLLRVGAAFGLC
jgi:hypothetical protein